LPTAYIARHRLDAMLTATFILDRFFEVLETEMPLVSTRMHGLCQRLHNLKRELKPIIKAFEKDEEAGRPITEPANYTLLLDTWNALQIDMNVVFDAMSKAAFGGKWQNQKLALQTSLHQLASELATVVNKVGTTVHATNVEAVGSNSKELVDTVERVKQTFATIRQEPDAQVVEAAWLAENSELVSEIGTQEQELRTLTSGRLGAAPLTNAVTEVAEGLGFHSDAAAAGKTYFERRDAELKHLQDLFGEQLPDIISRVRNVMAQKRWVNFLGKHGVEYLHLPKNQPHLPADQPAQLGRWDAALFFYRLSQGNFFFSLGERRTPVRLGVELALFEDQIMRGFEFEYVLVNCVRSGDIFVSEVHIESFEIEARSEAGEG
jgi:primosomal protein N''